MLKTVICFMLFIGYCFGQNKLDVNRFDVMPAKVTYTAKTGTMIEFNTAYLIDHKTGQVWFHSYSTAEDGSMNNYWKPIENYQLGQTKEKKEN
jgi:hypothetical protein